MNKKNYSVVLLLAGILVLTGAGCGNQETDILSPTQDIYEVETVENVNGSEETKEKSVLDVETYKEGLAMCQSESSGISGLCYMLLGAKFDRPEVCEYLWFDTYGKKECEDDAKNGFADTKEMIRVLEIVNNQEKYEN